MALVSYDQVRQSQENNASLLYWTIVGMYVIPGNTHTVQTFVDTAIFDVNSRQMMFRAPGVSQLNKVSTAVGIDAVLGETSAKGFDLAVIDMIKNLDVGLTCFRSRVKKGGVVSVVHRSGYSSGSGGGGALNTHFLYLFIFILIFRWSIHRMGSHSLRRSISRRYE